MQSGLNPDLKSVVREFWRTVESPGLSVSVRENQTELLRYCAGFANLTSTRPISAATLFPIGSITKQFTAAAVLDLCAKGLLTLDTPVRRIIPELDEAASGVCVRHLLSHTSGIASEADVEMLKRGVNAPLGQAEALRMRAELAQPAGLQWTYSNVGYYLLGVIVARITSRQFAEYMNDDFLRRFASRNELTFDPSSDPDRLATGYARIDGDFREVELPTDETSLGSGGLYATADALTKWTVALFDGSIGGDRLLHQMIEPVALTDGSATPYGFGLFIGSLEGQREYSHDGNSAGFSTQLAYYPERKLAIAVMLNSRKHHAEVLANRLARAVHGFAANDIHLSIIANPFLERFVGRYDYGGRDLHVNADEACLKVETPAGRIAELRALSATTFCDCNDESVRYDFAQSADGRMAMKVMRFGKTIALLTRVQ